MNIQCQENDQIKAQTKRRHPWLAALLSLIFGWLGQVYNRQPRRAAVIFLVDLTMGLVVMFIPPRTFVLMAALFSCLVLWRLVVVADAFIQARRLGAIPLARYNRSSYISGLWLPRC